MAGGGDGGEMWWLCYGWMWMWWVDVDFFFFFLLLFVVVVDLASGWWR